MVRSQSGQLFNHFFASFGRLIHEINVGLAALHRVQFETPWKPVHRPTYGEW